MPVYEPSDARSYLTSLCRTVPFHIIEALIQDASEKALYPSVFTGSVMFVDVVGFTSLSERMTDADGGSGALTDLLDRLFGALLEDGIFPFSGYVVQFGGDSMTVVFKNEQYALRACGSAQACRDIVLQHFATDGQDDDLSMKIRVSVATGQVRLIVVGDLVRRVTVCAGATAHRALVMQKRTPPNGVGIDAETVHQVGDQVAVQSQDPDLWILQQLRVTLARHHVVDLHNFLQHDVANKIALLEPFVSRPLANRLRLTPLGWRLTPEIRDAVIMFAELWGLDEVDDRVSLSLQTASDMGRSLLRCIYKYGGVISKVDIADRGHRLLISFGLHKPSDNDAERGILAALEATAKIRSFAGERSSHIGVRIGLHSGRVFFGSIGSDLKHDITVIGDTVNVAARATSVASDFEVLVTDAVAEQISGFFQLSPRGLVTVKGKRQGLQLFQVHSSLRQRAHSLHLRGARRPLLGVQPELTRLHEVVSSAFAGKARLLGIVGEQGVGKSAILAHVVDAWLALGGKGSIGRCSFAAKAYPLAPVVSMLNNFLDITGVEKEHERASRIRAGLLNRFQFQEGVPELVALMQPVMRSDGAVETALDLSDNHVRERLLSALVRFIEQRIDSEPLLYIVEDLHHADSLTLQLFNYVTAIRRDRPFLFIVTFRPTQGLQIIRRSLDFEVELGPLSDSDAEILMQRSLRAESIEPGLAKFIHQRSLGNPAHINEILGFLSDHHLLQVLGGQARSVDASLDQFDSIVPRSMAHVALARIENLGEAERRIVRTASTIGPRFSESVLDASCEAELDQDMVAAAVEHLAEAQIFHSEDAGDVYRFSEESVRAVAYSTIPQRQRAKVHQRVADALERAHLNLGAHHATALAYHREHAGQLELAAHWYEQAITTTVSNGLDSEALRLEGHWRQVLRGLPGASQPPAQRRAQTLFWVTVAAGHRGMWTKVWELSIELAGLPTDLLKRDQSHIFDFYRAHSAAVRGQTKLGRELWQQLLQQSISPSLRRLVLEALARQDLFVADISAAQAWLEQIADNDEVPWLSNARTRLLAAQVQATADLDSHLVMIFSEIAEGARARSLFELAGQAQLSAGLWALYRKDLDAALALLQQALDWVRTGDYPPIEARSLSALGQALLWKGRTGDARQHFLQALSVANHCGDLRVATEAELHLRAGLQYTDDLSDRQQQLQVLRQRCRQAGWRDLLWVDAFYGFSQGDDQAKALAVDARLPWSRFPLYREIIEQR